MKLAYNITIITLILVPFCLSVYALEERVIIEEFNDLDNWEPLYFKKIKEHTKYSIFKEEEQSYLKTESNASASAIVFNKEFNVYEFPHLKWKWKVSNVYEKGNAGFKESDDYPLRIYVMFKYDPDRTSFGKKFKYGFAKKMYGKYPPHSTLNYIWANRKHEKDILTNSYAKEAKMIVVQSGTENIGKWLEHEVNILEDYRKAFGKDPPEEASIAIMNDSDNTGESSLSFVDYLEVF